MIIDRRGAIVALAALATTALVSPLSARGPRRRALGLADITVRKSLEEDYAGTVRLASKMGYSHFGFRLADPARGRREPSASDKVRMIRDAGMEPGVARFNPIDPDFDRQIADAAGIGVRTIVMTAAPPFLTSRPVGSTTRATFDAWLPELATIAAKCRSAGLTFAYHNHAWDMAPLGNETPLDIIARSIPASDLSFEIDLAWTWHGGADPLSLLARLGPRVVSLHLKDIDRRRGTSPGDLAVVIGEGEMGYAALLPRILKLTSAIPYVEVDAPTDGLQAAARAARFFRTHAH